MQLSDPLAVFYRAYPYRKISVAGTPWRYRTAGAADGPALLLLTGGTLVPPAPAGSSTRCSGFTSPSASLQPWISTSGPSSRSSAITSPPAPAAPAARMTQGGPEPVPPTAVGVHAPRPVTARRVAVVPELSTGRTVHQDAGHQRPQPDSDLREKPC
jgi:hypothetical protein